MNREELQERIDWIEAELATGDDDICVPSAEERAALELELQQLLAQLASDTTNA
jgi:hypothetical protein